MQDLIKKAKNIRLVIFDVDGVLTDGSLIYGPHGNELKAFHVSDGMGIRMLQKSHIEIGIITARRSEAVTQRMQDLEIQHVYQHCADKVPAYEQIKQQLQLNDSQIAYMGDDLPDLPLLRRAGLAITVPNASQIIQQHAHWVTKAKGGKGAVREACDFILKAQENYDRIIQHYLSR
jgi:3-deoxy-D-manno-octulosonate 8-phosphate phosphatase (KDO 8-P phosphatase)